MFCPHCGAHCQPVCTHADACGFCYTCPTCQAHWSWVDCDFHLEEGDECAVHDQCPACLRKV